MTDRRVATAYPRVRSRIEFGFRKFRIFQEMIPAWVAILPFSGRSPFQSAVLVIYFPHEFLSLCFLYRNRVVLESVARGGRGKGKRNEIGRQPRVSCRVGSGARVSTRTDGPRYSLDGSRGQRGSIQCVPGQTLYHLWVGQLVKLPGKTARVAGSV